MTTRGTAAAVEPLDGFPHARIVFQPIVDLRSWAVVGFEALARFDDGGSPPSYLAHAEELGVREELELLLIAQAVAITPELPEGMSVTVNASGATVLREELAAVVAPVTRRWGVEITEGETEADLAAVRERVTALGGGLLVDDAGAVCADETRIARLRPDVVKIDRGLFWQPAGDRDARARLDSLLAAAREAGAGVLVEGVADAEHVERAIALGFDYGQGYHLGMPTPVDQIGELLSDLHRSIGVDAPGL
ncbi:EAL domain-containing protein [Microbacterium sp. XT11]|uniref:EAL domain-containing protein n=1 Tax=Microbacterium sp. XT11 TaxID=367477 RepID=UPI00082BFBD0|nr:EAL domain-containing protein [Microbacterium sp. XT11]